MLPPYDARSEHDDDVQPRRCWPIAAVAIVALTASLYFQRPSAERPIANDHWIERISAMDG